MSEPWIIFLVGFFFTLVIAIITVWSTFYASNKYKESKKTIVIGSIAIVIYLVILASYLGSAQKLLVSFSEVLSKPVNLLALMIWTSLVFIVPKILTFSLKKIFTQQVIKTRRRPRRPVRRNRNGNQNIILRDPLTVNLSAWRVITGSPQISNIRGYNANSSLLLEEYPVDKRNSFIMANTRQIRNGKIECDIYLERDALVNIVFRADTDSEKFYMARIDSRNGGSSGILYCEQYTGWNYIQTPNIVATSDHWYHVEITFTENSITLKIDNTVISLNDQRITVSGHVGIFNEVKRAFVNNFIVTEITS